MKCIGNAKRVGYCPFQGLCRNRDFSVATEFFLDLFHDSGLCRDRIWAGLVFLGCDKEFLVSVKPPGSMSRQGFPRVAI